MQQKQLLHSSDDVATAAHDDHNCSHSVAAKKRLTLGDVTTLNITRLHTGGGEAEAYNVVPAVCEMAMDIRISPRVAPEEMRAVLQHWCEEAEAAATGLPASGGVSWKYHINQVSSSLRVWVGIACLAVSDASLRMHCHATTGATTRSHVHQFH